MTDQEKDYKKMGEELLETAWNTLNTGEWKLEKKLENGDMVQVVKIELLSFIDSQNSSLLLTINVKKLPI